VSVLEILLRGFAVGALLATSAGMLASQTRSAARWSGVVLCWSVAAFAVHSGGPESAALAPIEPLLWLLSAGGAGYLHLFAASLFEDRPFTRWRLAPPVVLTGVAAVALALPSGPERGAWVIHNLLEVGVVAHVVLLVWRTWSHDLLESRRALRGPFIGAVACYTAVLSGLEIAEELGVGLAHAGALQAATLAVVTLLGACVFLQAKPALFAAVPRATPAQSQPEEPSARDRVALERLGVLMQGDEVWRREGLTVAQLAEAVGTQEHRLRRLVNTTLGHRNFAEFLNARRIEAARAALADPARASAAISTIAFELGYASLGPFNRAFKDATGATPTVWRRAALSASGGGAPTAGEAVSTGATLAPKV
jgi:AraC-like DNA-binding protein